MLESRVPRTRSTPKEETEAETKEDMAYTPIGIPLIAGPGAISSVMIFHLRQIIGNINWFYWA